MSLLEIVGHVIELSSTYQEPQPDSPHMTQEIDPSPFPEPGQDSDKSWFDEMLKPSPSDVALQEYFSTLDDRQVYLVVTIMCIGRGDISPRNWRNAIEDFRDTFPNAERAWQHVYRKAPFAAYLQEGLKKLEAAGVDVNAMPDELLRSRRL